MKKHLLAGSMTEKQWWTHTLNSLEYGSPEWQGLRIEAAVENYQAHGFHKPAVMVRNVLRGYASAVAAQTRESLNVQRARHTKGMEDTMMR